MRVAVVGSRGIRDADMSLYIPHDATEIITGGAAGVDTLAEQYGNARGIPVRVIRPAYEILGRLATLARNDEIVGLAELVVAVWDGASPGTRYTIARAERMGKPVKVYVIK